VLRLTLSPEGKFLEGRIVPLVQHPGTGPAPDPGARAVGLVRRLSREDFGAGGAVVDAGGSFGPPPAPREAGAGREGADP